MTRAAESVPANIVEGCYASSPREFARFLEISLRSTGELEYHVQLAHDCGVISWRVWGTLTSAVRETRRMLVGLRKRVLLSSE